MAANVGKDVGKRGAFMFCYWECKMMRLLSKSVWMFVEELNHITQLSLSCVDTLDTEMLKHPAYTPISVDALFITTK